MLGPTAPKIVGFSQDFPLLMLSQDFSSSDANFPTCPYKHTIMVTTESDPKQWLSVKLFLHIQKYVRQNLFM